MLLIIGGLFGCLLDGLEELPIDGGPCEGELLEDEPPEEDIEHLNNVANRVYPKILYA